MSDDVLKDLLRADPVQAAVPPVDYAFTISVMQTIERRRFYENAALLVVTGIAVTVLLGLVMPFITPALVGLSADILPAAIVLVSLAAIAFGYVNLRPALRTFGLDL